MLVAIKYTSIKPHVSDAPFKRLREHSLAPEMVILPNIALSMKILLRSPKTLTE
jgi:hypothetical protein